MKCVKYVRIGLGETVSREEDKMAISLDEGAKVKAEQERTEPTKTQSGMKYLS